MSDTPKILSASDLARAAGVTPGYIARLCRHGKIPARKLGSTWIIQERDAEAWLAKHSENPIED